MVEIVNLHIPPATHDIRAELPDRVDSKMDVFAHRIYGQLQKLFSGRGRLRRLVSQVEAAEKYWQTLDDQQLQRILIPKTRWLYNG